MDQLSPFGGPSSCEPWSPDISASLVPLVLLSLLGFVVVGMAVDSRDSPYTRRGVRQLLPLCKAPRTTIVFLGPNFRFAMYTGYLDIGFGRDVSRLKSTRAWPQIQNKSIVLALIDS